MSKKPTGRDVIAAMNGDAKAKAKLDKATGVYKGTEGAILRQKHNIKHAAARRVAAIEAYQVISKRCHKLRQQGDDALFTPMQISKLEDIAGLLLEKASFAIKDCEALEADLAIMEGRT